jgi:hypothetical protein
MEGSGQRTQGRTDDMTTPTPPDQETADKLADLLFSIGWKSSDDAQWTRIAEALPDIRSILAAQAPAVRQEPALTDERIADQGHAIALQRAIEAHARGEPVPQAAAILCPHHARMLDGLLVQQAAEAARISEAQPDLHAAIMNLPCNIPDAVDMSFDFVKRAYKMGHRDARHAAAELALSSPPAQPAAPAMDEWLKEAERLIAEYAIAVEATLCTDAPGTYRRRLSARTALLAHLRNLPSQQGCAGQCGAAIPEGWRFYSADFSLNAADPMKQGNILLIRDPDGVRQWHAATEADKEAISLYMSGCGYSFEEALTNAAHSAAPGAALSSPPEQPQQATYKPLQNNNLDAKTASQVAGYQNHEQPHLAAPQTSAAPEIGAAQADAAPLSPEPRRCSREQID